MTSPLQIPKSLSVIKDKMDRSYLSGGSLSTKPERMMKGVCFEEFADFNENTLNESVTSENNSCEFFYTRTYEERSPIP